MSTTDVHSAEVKRSADYLRELFPRGSTVQTVMRHASASGMTRWISVLACTPEDGIQDVSWYVAQVLGTRVNQGKHEGIRREGCGMDMGFDLVYSLSRALYPEFHCIATSDSDQWAGYQCPSNDHVNNRRDADPVGPEVVHSDGGYALKHRWV